MEDGRGNKISVRVNAQEKAQLRELAFRAGLPVAVFMRESALSGSPSAAKPPAELDLPDPCRKLLFVCQASTSNCTQLHFHLSAAGAPLDRVCPLLLQMREKLRALGLRVKAGLIVESLAVAILSSGLLEASDQLNVLAESLNEGQTATNQTWHTVLSALRASLEKVK